MHPIVSRIARLILLLAATFGVHSTAAAAEILPYGAKWHYFIGVSDPSTADASAWRRLGFNDSTWTVAPAPIGYANPPNAPVESALVTLIPSSQEGAYSSVFMRTEFVAKSPVPGNVFTVNVNIDDGCIVWINGTEVGRYNVPEGDLPFNSWASSALEASIVSFSVTNGVQGPVVSGTNVVAVQVFNANATSSDLVFDASVESDLDETPPVVLSSDPAAGGIVSELNTIGVVFNESVTGVDAADLLINGVAATSVSVVSPREYVFSFPQPTFGTVTVSWAARSQITDLAFNPFAGGSWSYSLEKSDSQAAVIISEFLADNGHGIKDEDGQRNDWIELLNTGATIANLGGWYLTDNSTNLTKWRLPALNLNPGQYFLIFASGKNRTNPAAPLHTSFKLDKGGGYLGLVNSETNVVSAFAPYPPQTEDISYGRDAFSPALTGYLGNPTPSAVNTASGAGFAPAPTIAVKGGVYTNASLSVSITAPSGQIRYTTDGSVPVVTSTLYTGPITVTTSMALKARVFNGNLLPSPVAAESYTLVDSTIARFSSNLPLLIFSTGARGVAQNVAPGQPRTFATVAAIDAFRGRAAVVGNPEFIGECELEVRGQSSTGFPKLPYNLEFQDEYRRDKNVGLFGLAKGSDWALYNPYTDKPFLQNFMAYELYEKMGHYSVRRRFVEVYLDTSGGKVTSSDYVGIYLLVEKIKIDNNRVDIQPLSPYNTTEPDISGGYMFKKDKDSTGDKNFSTAGGAGFSAQALKIHEPKPREITDTQLNWLRNYLIRMERALYASNWQTATGTNHYSAYLDVDSFVDYQWIVEFAKQIDGYRLSNYFYKPRNGKVHMSPIWDWNLSFGNADYLTGESTSGWYWQEIGENDHIWLRRLMSGTGDSAGTTGDPDFKQRVIDRWSELRTNVLSSTNVIARIQEMAGYLNEAAARDFQRWPRLGTYVWPNPPIYAQPTTYAGVVQSMTNWIKGRFNWIDSQFLPVPSLDLPEGLVRVGSTVSMDSFGAGAIYYTTDGSDPRAPGGAISGKALRYSGPLTISANSKVFARRLNGAVWSGPSVRSYSIQRPTLSVTEIMYHPAAAPIGSALDNDDFQFVELRNSGSTPLNVAGVQITGGIQFTFPSATLAPGAYTVVARNAAAFQSRYGNTNAVAGQFTGALNHTGDHIVVTGALGEPIADITFKDGWYPITDGTGFSLVPRLESGADLKDAAAWQPSGKQGGSPGQEDLPNGFPTASVIINEILVRPNGAGLQQVELANTSAAAVDIGGWFLSDDLQNPAKFRIPAGTVLSPHGFVVLSSDRFGGASAFSPFTLNAGGEEIYLFAADAAGNLTGYADGFEFPAQREGFSSGRYLDSNAEERLVTFGASTLGQTNSAPWEAPVILSEIMYHPPDVIVNNLPWNDTENEFVELFNRSSQSMPLFDPARPTNTWRLKGGIDFVFPPSITLPAGGVVLIVNFDPTLNPTQTAAFKAKYGVAGNPTILGPYQGNLANDSDRVSIEMPDTPLTTGPTTEIPYVLEDQIDYSDHGGWNSGADGLGFSLTRSDLAGFGNDSLKWTAAPPTPGSVPPANSGPIITAQPKTQFAVLGQQSALSVQATGANLTYQWFSKDEPLASATSANLVLSSVQATNNGDYYVVVMSSTGAVTSQRAYLHVSRDSDNDGMPDDWEFAWGLNPFDPSDAAKDLDGDGFSNHDEYIAGTNPSAGESRLAALPESGSRGVRFTASENRSYSVLYSDELTNGSWKKLTDVPAPTKGTDISVTDPNSSVHRYYRIVTPAP